MSALIGGFKRGMAETWKEIAGCQGFSGRMGGTGETRVKLSRGHCSGGEMSWYTSQNPYGRTARREDLSMCKFHAHTHTYVKMSQDGLQDVTK